MNFLDRLRGKAGLEKSTPATRRPELSQGSYATEIDIPAGDVMAKQGLAVPPGEFPYIELDCSSGHRNFVWKLPKPVFRLGTVRSPIYGIDCLKCTEGMIGGTIVQKP